MLLHLDPFFQHLWEIFKKNPALLNRRRGGEEITRGSIPKYDDIRQQILEAGAKESQKSLSIRMRHAVKKGQI